MRRTTKPVAGVAAALAISALLAGCGGADPAGGPSDAAPSSASTPASSPAPAGRAGPTAGVSTKHPGRIELVRADALADRRRCRARPVQGLVCAPGGTGYRFDPAEVRRVGVVRAAGTRAGDGSWTVRLTLGPAGGRVLARLTGTASRTHEAVLLMLPRTRRVLAAAEVQGVIRGGDLAIGGDYDRPAVSRIVRLITLTAG